MSMYLYCFNARLIECDTFAYLINVDGKLMPVHKPMHANLGHTFHGALLVLDVLWVPGDRADWLLGRMVLSVDNTDPVTLILSICP